MRIKSKLATTAATAVVAASLLLAPAAPAMAAPVQAAPSISVDVQPTHHRKYNKPTCAIAIMFVVFTGWYTVEQNCGGHRKIT